METTKIYNTDDIQDGIINNMLKEVANSLEEKGYNPINQIVGYLMSGDPGYISNHQNARNKIIKVDRTRLLEVLVSNLIK